MKRISDDRGRVAERELEAQLEQLARYATSSSESERFLVLVEPLTALERASQEEDESAYLESLLDLARATIRIRKEAKSDRKDSLARLPLPPYDLWLPFKAAHRLEADKKDRPSYIPVWNKQIPLVASKIRKFLEEWRMEAVDTEAGPKDQRR